MKPSTIARLSPTQALDSGIERVHVQPWNPPMTLRFRVWCFAPLITTAGETVWSPADFPTLSEANEVCRTFKSHNLPCYVEVSPLVSKS